MKAVRTFCNNHTRLFVRSLLVLLFLLTIVKARHVVAQPDKEGQWGHDFDTHNVMIHASVLPNGKVLFWGRREGHEGLDPRRCQPWIWDPAKGTGASAFVKTDTPKDQSHNEYNLFCSGHTFLPDGRLFVAGGHIADGRGEAHATIFDPADNTWHIVEHEMSGGRWYPTATTLSDGRVLVSFGTNEQGNNNITQQVWHDGNWEDTAVFDPPPYYPRMHVISDGHVFMSGPLALTQYLDVPSKTWNFLHEDPDINKAVALSSRTTHKLQEYAPSVLYDTDKIVFIGGGNKPLNDVEILDLRASAPQWKNTGAMQFARRQHNATLLPDGTIVVMGGTQGQGAKYAGEEAGFNDLTIGAPIRSAEIWDPHSGLWNKCAKADVDRCYHSTAFLLPDATVVSAGGGEYNPPRQLGHQNLSEDTHKNAQIFSPPFLFRGARPDIASAPNKVTYGEKFTVGTSAPNNVSAVNWVRLSSVTHSNNMNQRINFLEFAVAGGSSLTVTSPADSKLCPPGHYMLFVLNKKGVPSISKTIRIQ